jgi:hypothetical protein
MSARPFQVDDLVRFASGRFGLVTHLTESDGITELHVKRAGVVYFMDPREVELVTDPVAYNRVVHLGLPAEAPARRKPATYDCPCGHHIVDWSDDVEGFYDDIADHEATCDGLNEFERERERVDVVGPGTALMVRPFHVWDEVEIDGEPGVIVELRDEALRGVPGVYLMASMTGFPFPAWDAVSLTPDRTRSTDGRRIEWVDVVDGPGQSRFAPPADAPRAWEGWVPPSELLPEWMYGGDPTGPGVFAIRRDEAELERPVLQNSTAGLASLVGAR